MTIHYHESSHAGYLELACTAEYAPDLPMTIAEEGLRRAAAAGQHALLLDIRNVAGRAPTLSERFEQAVQFADIQSRVAPHIRVALLGNEPMVHPQRFGEIVATDHGGLIRVFTDRGLALDWLLQEPKPA